MKRTISVLAVAALMAVMLMAMAAPAFAVGQGPAPYGMKDLARPVLGEFPLGDPLGKVLGPCNRSPFFQCNANPDQPFD